MANVEIKRLAEERGVRLWQIAEKCGVTDSTFSRKLRKELPEAEKQKIRNFIAELSTQGV
jgi:predicted XRE-type DNA-binding protein